MPTSAPDKTWIRTGVGLGISLVFLLITLSRVDLELLGKAWQGIVPATLVSAIVLATIEVAVRAERWRVLLKPIAASAFLTAYGLLAIGHLGNAALPARLGDLGRAVIAGSRLHASRTAVLGTIAVERVADAGLLVAAGAAGIVAGYGAALQGTLVLLILSGAAAGIAVVGGALLLQRSSLGRTRFGARVQEYGRLAASGASALKDPWQAARVGALSLASFAVAILILQACAWSLSLTLTLGQSAVVIAAVTLSTAIPAGPASIGTYEFVGMTVMSTMGFTPEQSLMAVGLLHAIATLTPACLGAASLWLMGVSLDFHPDRSLFRTRSSLP